jgi:hypothetical protein
MLYGGRCSITNSDIQAQRISRDLQGVQLPRKAVRYAGECAAARGLARAWALDSQGVEARREPGVARDGDVACMQFLRTAAMQRT